MAIFSLAAIFEIGAALSSVGAFLSSGVGAWPSANSAAEYRADDLEER